MDGTQVASIGTKGNPHCLLTDDCLFMLFMSRNDIRRRMLPTPDLRPPPSSLFTILWVFGLALGRFGTTAPALRVKSVKKDSLSVANFRNALSKSTSLRLVVVPLICMPLMVVLLLLLSVPLRSGEREMEAIESLASSDNRDKRWYEFLLTWRGVAGMISWFSYPDSDVLSSSIVCSTGGCGESWAVSSGLLVLPHLSCSLSTPTSSQSAV